MGKIVYLMGKSATGKDTVYSRLKGDETLGLKSVVLYTTRPIRAGETEGVTYYYCNEEFFREQKQAGRVIESRMYPSMLGPWYYFTLDDGQIKVEENSYLIIGTLESYAGMKQYFGSDVMVPVYLEINDAERLRRAWSRECSQKVPRFDEVCRRYLADEADFSEEKLAELGITQRFCNDNVDKCCDRIKAFIRGLL